MNPVKLKERQVAIAATPLNNRNVVHNGGRRQLPKNNIVAENSIDQNYSNFFDYEKELSGLKPSSELFSKFENESKEDELKEDKPSPENRSMMLDDQEEFLTIDSETSNSSVILEDLDPVNSSFDFVQCEFIKQNGERCKRQAPKNHKLCSKHKNLTLI